MALFGGKPPVEKEKSEQNLVQYLQAKKVENLEEQFEVSGYGTLSSYNTLDVTAEAQGKMTEGNKPLKPGINFKRGDLLFRIDDVELRYSIRSRKSAYINLLANILPDIKIDFNGEYKKWSDYINEIKLNELLPTLPSWTSEKEKIFLSTRNVLSEYFAIKSQEEQLRKYAVSAPFNGVITDVYLNNLSFVNPGAKVIRIVETGNYEIPVAVPTSQLHLINIGTKCRILSTAGEEKGEGTVARISEVINKSTQSVNVYVKPNSKSATKFYEGEYVLVKIDAQTTHTGLRIPLSAIDENQVFVYSSTDSLLQKRPIDILNENKNGAFISGLKNNEIVIVQEVLNFKDSTKYGVILK